jgi:subtilisin-like proprotein convertase family protein
MDARKPLLCAVAIFTVGVQCSFNVYANSVTYSGDFNLRIPAKAGDTKGWMNDAVIEVPDHFIIHDINVGITLTHTSDFDLQISLKSPAGKTIYLNMYNLDQFFKGANYTNTIFDDEAMLAIEQAQPPFTGRFRPLEPYKLSAFDGKDAFGTWSLRIYDAHYYDTGTLNKFELVITNPEPATAVFLAVGFGLMTLLNHRGKSNYRPI